MHPKLHDPPPRKQNSGYSLLSVRQPVPGYEAEAKVELMLVNTWLRAVPTTFSPEVEPKATRATTIAYSTRSWPVSLAVRS